MPIRLLDRILGLEKYKRAITLYEKGMYRQAIPLFQEIISENPSPSRLRYHLASYYCSQAHYYLGRMLFALGSYVEAAREFELVLAMIPERSEVYEHLGACYYFLGDTRQAKDAMDRRVAVTPSIFEDQVTLAFAFHRLELWQRTAQTLRSFITANPDYADMHFHLGLASLGQSDPREAVQHFEKALALNPDYWKARLKLGVTLAYLGNFDHAGAHLSRTLEHFPDFPDLFYYQGLIKASLGKAEEALDAFGKALERNPGYANARIKLAAMLWGSGKPEAAKETLREGIGLDPKDLILGAFLKYFDRVAPSSGAGLFPSQTGKMREADIFKLAMGDPHRTIAIAPNFSEMLSLAGQAVGSDQELDKKLIETVRWTFSAHKGFPDYHYGVGSIFLKARKYEDAEKHLRNALDIKPDYLEAHLLLFHSLRSRQEPESALAEARFILDREISYPDFYRALGEVYLSLKQYDNAREAAQRACELNPKDPKTLALREKLKNKS